MFVGLIITGRRILVVDRTLSMNSRQLIGGWYARKEVPRYRNINHVLHLGNLVWQIRQTLKKLSYQKQGLHGVRR